MTCQEPTGSCSAHLDMCKDEKHLHFWGYVNGLVMLFFRFPADTCWCRWLVTEAQHYHCCHNPCILEECYCCICCCLLSCKIKRLRLKMSPVERICFYFQEFGQFHYIIYCKMYFIQKTVFEQISLINTKFNACYKMPTFPRENMLLFMDAIWVN